MITLVILVGAPKIKAVSKMIVVPDNYPIMLPISAATPTPAVPEFSWLGILLLLFLMFSITVVLRYLKTTS